KSAGKVRVFTAPGAKNRFNYNGRPRRVSSTVRPHGGYPNGLGERLIDVRQNLVTQIMKASRKRHFRASCPLFSVADRRQLLGILGARRRSRTRAAMQRVRLGLAVDALVHRKQSLLGIELPTERIDSFHVRRRSLVGLEHAACTDREDLGSRGRNAKLGAV